MSIRSGETTATDEILRDSRFHRATVKADPRTRTLGERVESAENLLKEKRAISEQKEDMRIEKFALLMRADFESDEAIRRVELDVLSEVSKERSEAAYRSCFPRGLSELVAMRGDEQKLEVDKLVAALVRQYPALHDRHGGRLTELAATAVLAERAWREAERDANVVGLDERLARVDLVRQLQKNEGALAEIFPGQRRRVRSFFRPTRRRGAAPPTDTSETTTG